MLLRYAFATRTALRALLSNGKQGSLLHADKGSRLNGLATE
jgi:hypothetical protein